MSDTVMIVRTTEWHPTDFLDALRGVLRNGTTDVTPDQRLLVRAVLGAEPGEGVECERVDADAIVSWCATVRGFDAGPRHAREALTIDEV